MTVIEVRRQNGLALVALVAFMMVVVAGTVVSAFSLSRIRMERDARTTAALAEVRTALTGWSVSHPNHPGMLPYPDRNNDGNYDGNSDCVTAPPGDAHLLGRIPWLGQTNPCVLPHSGLSANPPDGFGETLWMAVSRNLVHMRGSCLLWSLALRDSSPPVPWMTVLDSVGSVVSTRVAAVVLAPGAALGAQVRGGAAPAPGHFLDSYLVGAVMRNNADNTDLTFVAAEAGPTFNDRLTFITIEQWVDALVPRVIGEVRTTLAGYLAAHGAFPPFAAAAGDGVCVNGTATGLLPLFDGDCGTSLAGFLPAGSLGDWFAGWGPDIGYRRDAPLLATITIDGVNHVIAP